MAFTPIPTDDKLALFLKRLATAEGYFYLAQKFDMCVSKVHYVMKEVIKVFLTEFGDEIRLPTREEALASEARFAKKHNCPGMGIEVATSKCAKQRQSPRSSQVYFGVLCSFDASLRACAVAAMDGCHIRYHCPVEKKHAHLCFKSFHTLSLTRSTCTSYGLL
jgi:hypothetical protein